VAGQALSAGFELAGTLRAVTVDAGDSVAAGTELARLDARRIRARLAELAQSERAAEARLRLAALRRQRLAEARVADPDAVSEIDLDEARETVAWRTAELEALRQRIRRLEVDLADTTIEAPFDAAVTVRHLDPGAVVEPGTPVLDLIEAGRPEARVGLPTAAAARLTPGQSLRLVAGDRLLNGRLRRVLALEQGANRTIEAVIDLTEAARDLAAGSVVELTLRTRSERVGFWLPLEALTASARGLWAIYVAEPLPVPDSATHRIARREVEVVYERQGRVFIAAEAPPSAPVVTAGAHRLSPGQRVRLDAATEPVS